MILNGIVGDFFSNITSYLGVESVWSTILMILDIGIVAYLVYKLIMVVKETRAWQLIKGIILILLASEISKLIGLKTIATILSSTISIIAFALVVIFQPELRRGLEQIGRSRFTNLFNFDDAGNKIQITAVIEEIIKAVVRLSKDLIGAIIVIERDTKIGEIINTGVEIDANVSSEILINLFMPKTPLHDGAVIIRGNKIKAAACFLPLTDNPYLSKELGSRHRAALGLSEISDAITIIISEENGKISFALNGGLTRSLNSDSLRKALHKNLLEKIVPLKRINLWKGKTK